MATENQFQIVRDIIGKDKWWDILSRFISVLRINIFIVDQNGLVILPPEESRYGGRLLFDRSLGFDLFQDSFNIISQFDWQGDFLESYNRYDLKCFAIPIKINQDQIVAYMVIGPIILNRRLQKEEYVEMAKQNIVDSDDLISVLSEVRVMSNIMVRSIIELLSEIVKDNIELSIKKNELDKLKINQEQYSKDFANLAQEIYSTVCLDEILATLLDVALKITKTEGGSILVKDDKSEDYAVKVSRGINMKNIQDIRVKPGEGISGIAMKENLAFVINGGKADNRIKHLLQRPEIKHSLVMPLTLKSKVFGVLNLHTSKEESLIEANLENLQYLSKLLTSTFSY